MQKLGFYLGIMIADIGSITLVIAFLVAIYAVVAAIVGARRGDDRWVRSARNAIIIVFPLVVLACGLVITGLVTGDFSIAYVSQVSSRGMPTYLKVTALWGGQAGSLLFWNLLLSAFTAAAMLSKWRQQKELICLLYTSPSAPSAGAKCSSTRRWPGGWCRTTCGAARPAKGSRRATS